MAAAGKLVAAAGSEEDAVSPLPSNTPVPVARSDSGAERTAASPTAAGAPFSAEAMAAALVAELGAGAGAGAGATAAAASGGGEAAAAAGSGGAGTDDSRGIARYRPIKIAVFGSGSFGTAMGTVLARKGHEVWILTRRKEVEIKISAEHINPAAMSDFVLPFNVAATTDAAKALTGASYILHAIPVQASFDYLRELAPLIPATTPIINTSKGLHTERLCLMNELVNTALGRTQPFAAISGPTFAQELMKGFPSGAVCASADADLAADVAKLFTSPTLKVWTTTDVVGVEIAGALKNVYAIAAGSLEGLGLGMNTTALLCTRAIAEMNKVARALGSTEATLAGLSGLGDMVLTCFGKLSRNRTVGVRLGKGETIASIQASMSEVAEGVATAPAALKLARQHGIACPIIEVIVAVLDGKLPSPLPGLMALLALPAGEEKIM